MSHDAARLITPPAQPSTAAVILPPRHKRESPPVGGLLRLWPGWQDSNLRMAGSKPAIVTTIINKLLKLLTGRSPPVPSIPHRCHQSCHQPEPPTTLPASRNWHQSWHPRTDRDEGAPTSGARM